MRLNNDYENKYLKTSFWLNLTFVPVNRIRAWQTLREIAVEKKFIIRLFLFYLRRLQKISKRSVRVTKEKLSKKRGMK